MCAVIVAIRWSTFPYGKAAKEALRELFAVPFATVHPGCRCRRDVAPILLAPMASDCHKKHDPLNWRKHVVYGHDRCHADNANLATLHLP